MFKTTIPGNRLRNVRNYINSLLYQEQTDSTMPNTENTDTQNVFEETLLVQQFNDLLLELNQDTQDKYFNCQKNVILSQKNTTFSDHLKVISVFYH